MSGPNDRLSRALMLLPCRAALLLRLMVAPVFAAQAIWSTLRNLPTEWVSPALRDQRSDSAFSVQLRDSDQPALIIMEHQSTVEWDMAERLHNYMMAAREWHAERHPGRRLHPVTVGVLLYHGKEGPWTASTRMEELLDLRMTGAERAELLRSQVCMEYRPFDLMVRSEEELRVLPVDDVLRLMLLLLRRVSLGGGMEGWLWEQRDLFSRVYAAPEGMKALESFACYLREVAGDATEEVVGRILRCFLSMRRTEALMQTVADRFRAEGRVEGEIKGLSKGKAEAILQVLALRGVYVDSRSQQRILRCTDVATLDLWLARAVHARHLAEVLGPSRVAKTARRH
jgi:predicted transposase YdaD